jgi:hypothetical protein
MESIKSRAILGGLHILPFVVAEPSRAMRLTASKPMNATAMTIDKSEIGRRNANDTKFIVPPRKVCGTSMAAIEIWWDLEKCGPYFRPNAQPRSPMATIRHSEYPSEKITQIQYVDFSTYPNCVENALPASPGFREMSLDPGLISRAE